MRRQLLFLRLPKDQGPREEKVRIRVTLWIEADEIELLALDDIAVLRPPRVVEIPRLNDLRGHERLERVREAAREKRERVHALGEPAQLLERDGLLVALDDRLAPRRERHEVQGVLRLESDRHDEDEQEGDAGDHGEVE